jgi:hypothetical protein
LNKGRYKMSVINIFEKAAAEIWGSKCNEDVAILSVQQADIIIKEYKEIFKQIADTVICYNVKVNGKASNLFLCNDAAYGGKCESCGSDIYFVLIEDGLEPIQNSDYVTFNPSIETYIAKGCSPIYKDYFSKNAPIAIEVDKDNKLLHTYKYRCINCEGWKEFRYDRELGLII